MGTNAWDGLKWGQEDCVPTNPDLADILGRTDLEFEDFHFFHLVDPKFLHFQVPRFPKFGLGRAWLGPWGKGGGGVRCWLLTCLAGSGA